MNKLLDVLMIDEVAIDERLVVDTFVTPMPFMGICRHCRDPSFNTMDDNIRIENGLKYGTFHLAKDADVICIGLNRDISNSLIPMCVSPTCKKDKVDNKPTYTTHALIKAIIDVLYHVGYEELLGPLSLLIPDRAPAFLKAGGQLIKDVIPLAIGEEFKEARLFQYSC